LVVLKHRKKGASFTMILARTAAAIGIFTATTFSTFAATEHDNEVFFSVNGLESFTFSETNHSISPGQP
jgi:hypothetical protein